MCGGQTKREDGRERWVRHREGERMKMKKRESERRGGVRGGESEGKRERERREQEG